MSKRKTKKKNNTATGIMSEQIKVPCYLCGKGKITMKAGDVVTNFLHPIDVELRRQLELYLLHCAKTFIKMYRENQILYEENYEQQKTKKD